MTPIEGGTSPDAADRRSRERRRRLLVMGGVLGDVTRDETDEGWGSSPDGAAHAAEEQLRRDVPPHHGG